MGQKKERYAEIIDKEEKMCSLVKCKKLVLRRHGNCRKDF